MEVAPGVRWVRMPLPMELNHINLWLVDDGDSWTIVDTGLKNEKISELWERIFETELRDRSVRRVIVTHMHPDHIGQAGWLEERWGAELVMTRTEWLTGRMLSIDVRDELPEIVLDFHRKMGLPEDQIDVMRTQGYGNFAKGVHPIPIQFSRIVEGDVLRLGQRDWRVMIGEGHAPEHACLYCADLGVLLAGDQILPRISPIIGVYPGEPAANPLEDYLQSFEKFRELPDDTFVLPAHGKPFYGLRARIDQLIEHHEERCDILVTNGVTPLTVYDSLPLLFRRPLKGQNVFMAMAEALAHFNRLLSQGRMTRQTDAGGVNRYITIGQANAAA
jgi:glyoxylase-like metal-dependent hydrolase (beta-lactamase superfamily II)